MIVFNKGTHCRLITQPAHAWISGQIAEHWGANGFTRPEPWTDLCFVAANHDAGWVPWELNPTINEETGWPYDFKNIPVTDHLAIWEESPRRTELSNRFSALLVSLHVVGLSRMHDFSREPGHIREKARVFRVEQENLQNRLKESLRNDSYYHQFIETGLLNHHQRLTAVYDYLSLILCMGTVSNETVNSVPHEAGYISLNMQKVDGEDNVFMMDPWPFFRNDIFLHCDAKILTGKYENQEALSRGIQKAEQTVFKVRLRNPKNHENNII